MATAAVGQLCSTASMTHNLAQCRSLVQKAVSAGAKALFLPEASDYIAASPAETVALAVPIQTSPFVLGLQAEASKHKLPINVGIHEPTEEGKRVKNTLIWIDGRGSIAQRYQKLHLFDVEIENGPILKESNSVEPGNKILPPFDTAVGKVGEMICFDLRFPTLSTRIRDLGAQILTYPSAFTVPTGEAGHWEILLRARAIECQSYVIAAAQVGRHGGKRMSYGHSMVVDAWGKILGDAGGIEQWDASGQVPNIITAEIDLAKLERIRLEMPLRARRDIIDIVEK
ncbi:MAG: Carbon-nitrogen hydrolase [Ramalina farinacea]|uniref:Carbon-nitrogen hydrolase n=1 Tax=Ramalina farinacea TaxID=258253 RepID=A0AA43TZU0_9LECA|nr:Carbon-nitrogen hydrolase [Ramalina farinacea]